MSNQLTGSFSEAAIKASYGLLKDAVDTPLRSSKIGPDILFSPRICQSQWVLTERLVNRSDSKIYRAVCLDEYEQPAVELLAAAWQRGSESGCMRLLTRELHPPKTEPLERIQLGMLLMINNSLSCSFLATHIVSKVSLQHGISIQYG